MTDLQDKVSGGECSSFEQIKNINNNLNTSEDKSSFSSVVLSEIVQQNMDTFKNVQSSLINNSNGSENNYVCVTDFKPLCSNTCSEQGNDVISNAFSDKHIRLYNEECGLVAISPQDNSKLFFCHLSSQRNFITDHTKKFVNGEVLLNKEICDSNEYGTMSTSSIINTCLLAAQQTQVEERSIVKNNSSDNESKNSELLDNKIYSMRGFEKNSQLLSNTMNKTMNKGYNNGANITETTITDVSGSNVAYGTIQTHFLNIDRETLLFKEKCETKKDEESRHIQQYSEPFLDINIELHETIIQPIRNFSSGEVNIKEVMKQVIENKNTEIMFVTVQQHVVNNIIHYNVNQDYGFKFQRILTNVCGEVNFIKNCNVMDNCSEHVEKDITCTREDELNYQKINLKMSNVIQKDPKYAIKNNEPEERNRFTLMPYSPLQQLTCKNQNILDVIKDVFTPEIPLLKKERKSAKLSKLEYEVGIVDTYFHPKVVNVIQEEKGNMPQQNKVLLSAHTPTKTMKQNKNLNHGSTTEKHDQELLGVCESSYRKNKNVHTVYKISSKNNGDSSITERKYNFPEPKKQFETNKYIDQMPCDLSLNNYANEMNVFHENLLCTSELTATESSCKSHDVVDYERIDCMSKLNQYSYEDDNELDKFIDIAIKKYKDVNLKYDSQSDYSDEDVLEEQYSLCKRLVDYSDSSTNNSQLSHENSQDWNQSKQPTESKKYVCSTGANYNEFKQQSGSEIHELHLGKLYSGEKESSTNTSDETDKRSKRDAISCQNIIPSEEKSNIKMRDISVQTEKIEDSKDKVDTNLMKRRNIQALYLETTCSKKVKVDSLQSAIDCNLSENFKMECEESTDIDETCYTTNLKTLPKYLQKNEITSVTVPDINATLEKKEKSNLTLYETVEKCQNNHSQEARESNCKTKQQPDSCTSDVNNPVNNIMVSPKNSETYPEKRVHQNNQGPKLFKWKTGNKKMEFIYPKTVTDQPQNNVESCEENITDLQTPTYMCLAPLRVGLSKRARPAPLHRKTSSNKDARK